MLRTYLAKERERWVIYTVWKVKRLVVKRI